MNDLMEIKTVDFDGDKLLAVRDRGSGKVYVGINWVCRALGLNPRVQRDKIVGHSTLSQGCIIKCIPSNGGNQETYVMDIEFLPIWMVTITPGRVSPHIKEKLVDYQLKAKDVLANAFLQGNTQATYNASIIPQTLSGALFLAANLQKKIEEDAPKVQQFDEFISAHGMQTMNDVAKSLGTGRNRLMRHLRKMGVFMSDNMPYQRYINQGLFTAKQRVIMGRICVQPFATAKGVSFISEVL